MMRWVRRVSFALLFLLQACGASRQFVVPESAVFDLRSPAWIIHSVPQGAKMPDENDED